MTYLALLPWHRRLAWLLLGLIVLLAVAGPWLWPDPARQDLMQFLASPSLAEPLGRDQLGRSVMARVASATRLSLGLAALCVLSAALLGCLLGVLSAWRGGVTDTVLRGVADGVLALPGLADRADLLGHGQGWLCHPVSGASAGAMGRILPHDAGAQPAGAGQPARGSLAPAGLWPQAISCAATCGRSWRPCC